MLCDAQVKYATKLNVFATIANALHHSKTIRDGVRHVNELQVHGAVYDIFTGEVARLGGRLVPAPPPPLL